MSEYVNIHIWCTTYTSVRFGMTMGRCKFRPFLIKRGYIWSRGLSLSCFLCLPLSPSLLLYLSLPPLFLSFALSLPVSSSLIFPSFTLVRVGSDDVAVSVTVETVPNAFYTIRTNKIVSTPSFFNRFGLKMGHIRQRKIRQIAHIARPSACEHLTIFEIIFIR